MTFDRRLTTAGTQALLEQRPRIHVVRASTLTAAPSLGVGGEGYTIAGYATVYGVTYRVGGAYGFNETVMPGSGTLSLATTPDVPLLINHRGLPLATTRSGTLKLSEDHNGLRIQASLDPNDPEAQSLLIKLQRGDVTEMSFGFTVLDDYWDDQNRYITQYDIHRGDVSIVTHAANTATQIAVG